MYGYDKTLYTHTHAQQFIYPFLSGGVTLTAHNDAYTLGAKAEVIPTNIASEVLIAQVKFTKTTVAGNGVVSVPMMIPKQLPNTRISAAVACSGGAARTVIISFAGHEY